jgi:FkbM family methyltransferase
MSSFFETVYTFEPSPELFPLLVRNAPEPNVVRFQAALGASHGMVRTECSLRGRDGKSVLHEGMTRVEPGGTIPTIVLDQLVLPACGLIYLDVEGCELPTLRGASRTIERHRPIIACEVNRGMEYFGLNPSDLYSWMDGADYEHVATHRSDRVFAPR